MDQVQADVLFVTMLSRAVDLAAFYEPGDKVIGTIADPVADALFKAGESTNEVCVRVEELQINGGPPTPLVRCGETRVPGTPSIRLGRHLSLRQVQTIEFPLRAGRDDLWRFLVILAMPVDSVHEMGGLQGALDLVDSPVVVNEERRSGVVPGSERGEDDEMPRDPPWASRQGRGGTKISN